MKRNISITGKILNKNGFTLIELIVVMAVLAIIAAIAVPRFLGVQAQAKLDADYSTGAMIAKAAELYVITEDTVPDPFTAKVLVDDKYFDKIVFQSDTFKSFGDVDLTITLSENKVSTIVAGTGETAEDLYPKPTTP